MPPYDFVIHQNGFYSAKNYLSSTLIRLYDYLTFW